MTHHVPRLPEGTVFHQALPPDDVTPCPRVPSPAGADQDDGVVALALGFGETTTLDAQGARYSLSLSPEPAGSRQPPATGPDLASNDLSWLRSASSRPGSPPGSRAEPPFGGSRRADANARFDLTPTSGRRVIWIAQSSYRMHLAVRGTSAPGAFDVGAALVEPAEAELRVLGQPSGRVLHVECARAAGDEGQVHDGASGIRWVARICVVTGLVYTPYRKEILRHTGRGLRALLKKNRGSVPGPEPARIAGAVCLGFGIARGGVGVFACGVLGAGPGELDATAPREAPDHGRAGERGRLRLRYEGQFPRPGSYYDGPARDEEDMDHLPPGRSFEVSPSGIFAGRLPDADIEIRSPFVAPRHARLQRTEEGIEVTDLSSTNGTYVDGVSVEHGTLRLGGRLSLAGLYEFVVVPGDEA